MLVACLFVGSLGSAVVSYKKTSSNEVANPLVSESENENGFSQLPQTDPDMEAGTGPTDVTEMQQEPQPPAVADWKISLIQFLSGVPIHGAIIALMHSWEDDDPTSLLLKALCFVTIAVCIQNYFNFHLVWRRNGCCGALPGIQILRLKYPATDYDVSVGRWVAGPLTWITEIFTFLPPDAYKALQGQVSYFPEPALMRLVCLIQLLYCFGVYDVYRESLRPG